MFKSMGLSLDFGRWGTPRCPVDVANDGIVRVDGDVLDGDLLLSGTTVAVELTRKFASAAIFATMLPLSAASAQQATEIQISYSNGQFQPSEVRAPADKPVVFRIRNLDGKAMEFESTSLRVEKVVAAKSQGVVNVRALKAGRYEFYDDFDDNRAFALPVRPTQAQTLHARLQDADLTARRRAYCD